MDRYAAGDLSAFGELYDALAPRLWSLLCRRLHDRDRARDLLQEIMLKIHRARGGFIPGAAVAPWAFAIADRVILNESRLRRRKPPATGQTVESLGQATGEPSPEQLAESTELTTQLECEVARLPPRLRVTYDLVRSRGLTVSQAAGELGISPGAAKVRLHRAGLALRQALLLSSRKTAR
jgi:RNA polymerase sigma-70 factor (ECF subfamily)